MIRSLLTTAAIGIGALAATSAYAVDDTISGPTDAWSNQQLILKGARGEYKVQPGAYEGRAATTTTPRRTRQRYLPDARSMQMQDETGAVDPFSTNPDGSFYTRPNESD